MRRVAISMMLLASCRLNFDPLSTPSDATRDTGSRDSTVGDATTDGQTSPVVQAVAYDVPTGNLTVNATNGGLAPVTPGHMVMVICSHPSGTGPCLPVSTPAATWDQVDPGTTLGVYITCNAPAITAIQLSNGAQDMMAVVVEWSGLVTTNCLDTKRISTPCPTAPSTWNSMPTMNAVSQNRELIVSLGQAGAVDAGWTIDPPYVMAKNATGVNGVENVFVAYQLVDAAPMTYSSTGTVNQWSLSCFNDVFAFKAL